MARTSIEWTASDDGAEGSSWNPLRGCSVVSPGCHHCYARSMASRFSGPGKPFHGFAILTEHGPQWTGRVELVPEHLCDPLRWRTPRRVFLSSMSDMFHEELSNDDIAALFGVMAACSRHTFLCLTKRAKRMREWFEWVSKESGGDGQEEHYCGHKFEDRAPRNSERTFLTNDRHEPPQFGKPWCWPLPNVHLGVSVEDQQRADERMQHLLWTPAAVRFLSVEPLLGPVLLPSGALGRRADIFGTPLIHQVIVGSESGHGARPMQIEWARAIVERCKEAGCAVFVKQIATEIGKINGNAKGNDPKWWPPGDWPREFPETHS